MTFMDAWLAAVALMASWRVLAGAIEQRSTVLADAIRAAAS